MKFLLLQSVAALLATSTLVNAQQQAGGSLTLTVHGSGTTNPSKCYWHIMDKMEARSKQPLHMTYRGIGSSSGQKEFVITPPLTYFGSGDIPLTEERYNNVTASSGTILQLPVFVGAVSFFHNVPNTPTLNMSACTLAKIMKREITQWDNDEIKKDNPELKVPSAGFPITVARRTDGSSSTSGITNYLAKACPSVWDETNTGSTVEWTGDTLECQGSGGMVDCINQQDGTIGYLDAGHGHAEGFEEVYLENKDGTKLTTIQSRNRGGIAGAADAPGLLPATASDDFSHVSLIWQPGEFVWPIAAMTYVYVRQDLSFIPVAQEQALLKAFLQTLYDDSFVQQCVDAYEFAKVEGDALNIAKAAIDSLIVNANATPFTFEDDTDLYNATADYVISAKRRSATEVEIDVLTTANEQLQDRVVELEAQLQTTMLQLQASSSGGSSESSSSSASSPTLLDPDVSIQAMMDEQANKEDDQDASIAAALVLSIISIIISAVVLCMTVFRSFAGKHAPEAA